MDCTKVPLIRRPLWLKVAKQSTLVVKMAFCRTAQWLAITWPLRRSKPTRISLRYSGPLEPHKQTSSSKTIYVVKGQDIREGYAATQRAWGNFPTAISFAFVESLGVPGALIEIEAIAVIDA